MSVEAEAIQAALDAYRQFEHTDRRDEMYGRLVAAVEAVKRNNERPEPRKGRP